MCPWTASRRSRRYELFVADADGANRVRIATSPLPIMSPAWSPDGEWLAYVSFERRVSAIFVQHRRTGKKTMVSARAGINWRALVLARWQEARAHALGQQRQPRHLSTRARHREAHAPHRRPGHRHRGGVHARRQRDLLHFGSIRQSADLPAGARRLRAAAAASRSRAATTRARASRPDGKQLALLTLDDGAYRIGVQDLAERHAAGAVERPPGRISELRARTAPCSSSPAAIAARVCYRRSRSTA